MKLFRKKDRHASDAIDASAAAGGAVDGGGSAGAGSQAAITTMAAAYSQLVKLQQTCPVLRQSQSLSNNINSSQRHILNRHSSRTTPMIATLDIGEVHVSSSDKGLPSGRFYHAYSIKRINLNQQQQQQQQQQNPQDDGDSLTSLENLDSERETRAREDLAISALEQDPGFYNVKYISKKMYKKLQQQQQQLISISSGSTGDSTTATNSIYTTTNTDFSLLLKAVTNLLVEASYLSQLNHPNILQLKGQGSASIDQPERHDSFFVITERIQETLADRLEGWRQERNKNAALHPIGPSCPRFADKLQYAMDIASALEYLHSKGIMVLNLNPSTVGFLAHSGRLQLYDLGTCRELGGPVGVEEQNNLSRDGGDSTKSQNINLMEESIRFDDNEIGDGDFFAPTEETIIEARDPLMVPNVETGSVPRYMAPELVTHGEISIQADSYSWSMLAFELVTLDIPHAQFKAGQYHLKVCLEGKRPNLQIYRDDLPTILLELLKRAWRVEAEKRMVSSKIHQVMEQLLSRMGGSKTNLAGWKENNAESKNGNSSAMQDDTNTSYDDTRSSSRRVPSSTHQIPPMPSLRRNASEADPSLSKPTLQRHTSAPVHPRKDQSNTMGTSSKRRSSRKTTRESSPPMKDDARILGRTSDHKLGRRSDRKANDMISSSDHNKQARRLPPKTISTSSHKGSTRDASSRGDHPDKHSRRLPGRKNSKKNDLMKDDSNMSSAAEVKDKQARRSGKRPTKAASSKPSEDESGLRKSSHSHSPVRREGRKSGGGRSKPRSKEYRQDSQSQSGKKQGRRKKRETAKRINSQSMTNIMSDIEPLERRRLRRTTSAGDVFVKPTDDKVTLFEVGSTKKTTDRDGGVDKTAGDKVASLAVGSEDENTDKEDSLDPFRPDNEGLLHRLGASQELRFANEGQLKGGSRKIVTESSQDGDTSDDDAGVDQPGNLEQHSSTQSAAAPVNDVDNVGEHLFHTSIKIELEEVTDPARKISERTAPGIQRDRETNAITSEEAAAAVDDEDNAGKHLHRTSISNEEGEVTSPTLHNPERTPSVASPILLAPEVPSIPTDSTLTQGNDRIRKLTQEKEALEVQLENEIRNLRRQTELLPAATADQDQADLITPPVLCSRTDPDKHTPRQKTRDSWKNKTGKDGMARSSGHKALDSSKKRTSKDGISRSPGHSPLSAKQKPRRKRSGEATSNPERPIAKSTSFGAIDSAAATSRVVKSKSSFRDSTTTAVRPQTVKTGRRRSVDASVAKLAPGLPDLFQSDRSQKGEGASKNRAAKALFEKVQAAGDEEEEVRPTRERISKRSSKDKPSSRIKQQDSANSRPKQGDDSPDDKKKDKRSLLTKTGQMSNRAILSLVSPGLRKQRIKQMAQKGK